MSNSVYSVSLALSMADTTGKPRAKRSLGMVISLCLSLFSIFLYFI